ncbi:MAG: hypothetical protein K6G74_01270 [Bacilli bacterium]|nr:hypothetical protein [Bacilli bacterium]
MKHSKFLGVLAATLCLGLGTLASCDPAPEGEHSHKAAEGAEWKADDNNHWKECEAGDGAQVEKAKHKFGEGKQIKAPTCTETGSEEVTCEVCGKTVTRTVKANGHTYEKVDGKDKVTWTKEATCEEGGEGTKECTVCHEKTAVTSEPKNHTYEKVKDADGNDTTEDKVVWLHEATCLDSGLGYKVCTECNKAEEVIADPLGHEFVTNDTGEPAAGKAKVRMYECSHCGISYFGFKATEVTAASHDHLTFTGTGEDAGASFWGRPIGNAIALDENGTSVNQQGDECVYDVDESGDFFEYVFDLTAEQVDAIGRCRLYCEASAANYLSGDFWGRDQQGTDWTRGYYIDGADEHVEKDATSGETVMIQDNTTASRETPSTAGVPETLADGTSPKMVAKGKAITDARYILYVNDEVKAFESMTDIPARVTKGTQKDTYVMPYTFESLKVGENKISLRMAGGYRSTFYNFTFRSVEEEETGTVLTAHHWGNETAIAADTTKGTVAAKKATDSATNEVKYEIKLNDSMLAAGSENKNDPAGYIKLNGNNQSLSFKFETDAAMTGKIYQRGVMDGWASNKGKKLFTGKSNNDNLELKVNETAIDLSSYRTKKFEDVMVAGTVEGLSANTLVECGTVTLNAGVNEVSYKRLDSYNLALTDIVFIGTPAAAASTQA